MTIRTPLKTAFYLTSMLALSLVLAACSLAATPNEEPATFTIEAPELEPTETPVPAEPPTADYDSVSFSFGPDIASAWTVEFVPEGPGSSTSAGPQDHTDPEHIIFSLDYYAVPAPSPQSLHQPEIYIYPADLMSEQNPIAGTRIAELRTLLDSPPTDLMDQSKSLPFLPLFNAAQVFHSQVKFLDFQNGSGVRYLTMYSQGPMPVVNAGIFYTFQGLTTDGAYYIAAILPVNHPALKDNATEAFDTEGDSFMTDPITYIQGISEQLDRQASATFTPDLAALDAMIETLLVHP